MYRYQYVCRLMFTICTVITVAQDFEDWDDVGLNMPKPPGVVQLFRDFGTHVSPAQDTQDAGCQADIEDLQSSELIQELEDTRQQLVNGRSHTWSTIVIVIVITYANMLYLLLFAWLRAVHSDFYQLIHFPTCKTIVLRSTW